MDNINQPEHSEDSIAQQEQYKENINLQAVKKNAGKTLKNTEQTAQTLPMNKKTDGPNRPST